MAVNLWPNADLESGVDDWNDDYNCSLSQSSTQAQEQTYSLKVAGGAGGYARIRSDVKSIVDASTQYTASWYVYPETSDFLPETYIYDQDSNQLGYKNLGTLTAGQWTRVDITFTTGAGDTGLKIGFDQRNSDQRTYYLDAVMVETGGSASAWVNYSAGVEVTQSPIGALAIAGLTPAVKADSSLDPTPVGALSITGFNPTVGAATGLWEMGAYIYDVIASGTPDPTIVIQNIYGSLVISGFRPHIDVAPGGTSSSLRLHHLLKKEDGA